MSKIISFKTRVKKLEERSLALRIGWKLHDYVNDPNHQEGLKALHEAIRREEKRTGNKPNHSRKKFQDTSPDMNFSRLEWAATKRKKNGSKRAKAKDL